MGSLMFAHEWSDPFGAGLIIKREVGSPHVGVVIGCGRMRSRDRGEPMKLKLFTAKYAEDVEGAVNAWLAAQKDKIAVTRSEITMSSVLEKPKDGSYFSIVAAIWYSEL